jgi:hypothetical protein
MPNVATIATVDISFHTLLLLIEESLPSARVYRP